MSHTGHILVGIGVIMTAVMVIAVFAIAGRLFYKNWKNKKGK